MKRPLILIAVVAFWAMALNGLTAIPMQQDEPWIASTSAQLAETGVYGSAMLAGYYGSDQHYYQNMPAYALVQAGLFKVLGVGVFQMRLLSVMAGTLVAALTYTVARQFGGVSMGCVAALLLMGLRLARASGTGLPLLDSAQLARYDALVPVCTLAAVWLFNHAYASRKPRNRLYVLVGALIGVAAMFDVYGLLVLPLLILASLFRAGRDSWRVPAPYLMMLGCALVGLMWLDYAAADWADYLGQNRLNATVFDVSNPRFYLNNLLHEIDRYGEVRLWPFNTTSFIQGFGTWLILIAFLIAIVSLIVSARRNRTAVWLIAVLSVGQQALFAVLLASKTPHYFIALWPYIVIALAWLIVMVWRKGHTGARQNPAPMQRRRFEVTPRGPRAGRPSAWTRFRWRSTLSHELLASLGRVAVMVCAILALIDTAGALWQRQETLSSIPSYDSFTAQVTQLIPTRARVLGSQTYWLGLRQFDYHAWLVPLWLADARYTAAPLPLDAALAAIKPDVILIDPGVREALAAMARPDHPRHAIFEQYQSYISEHRARLIGEVDNAAYGLVQVYAVRQSGSP